MGNNDSKNHTRKESMLHLCVLLRQGTGERNNKGLFSPFGTFLLKYRPEYLINSCCCVILYVEIYYCHELLNSGKDAVKVKVERRPVFYFLFLDFIGIFGNVG